MSDSFRPHGLCSPLGSTAHGVLQARILEWIAVPFSRGPSWPRDRSRVSCTAGRLFTVRDYKQIHNAPVRLSKVSLCLNSPSLSCLLLTVELVLLPPKVSSFPPWGLTPLALSVWYLCCHLAPSYCLSSSYTFPGLASLSLGAFSSRKPSFLPSSPWIPTCSHVQAKALLCLHSIPCSYYHSIC